jgi:ribosome-binding protein aMBF1 (putative translation factor)
MAVDVSQLLKSARSLSGLSQRELARKARTAQSVVARIELRETSPSWETTTRLLRAAGFKLHAVLEKPSIVDKSILDDVPRILQLTPEQRLQEVGAVSRFIAAARRV